MKAAPRKTKSTTASPDGTSKPIYLIGFMGAGKSTVAKKLASKLKLKFYDLDTLIEEGTGKPISVLFEKKGEEKFRDIEKKYLHKTKSLTNCVIATGGGTPCFFDNMEWINEHGTSVYLQLHPGSLFHRIAQSKEKRPLIKDLSDTDLMDYIMTQIALRERFYKLAHHTIKGESLNIDALIKKVKG